MQRWTSILTVSILLALALSITLPPLQDANNISQPPTLSPSLLSAENTSTTYTNTSLGKILKINCDPVRYGRNLKVSSCKNVFTYLAPNDTQTVFAERGAVQPHDMNLPYRITSSDARCYIQPLLAPDAPTGRASPQEILNAASTLYQHCVLPLGVGGLASDIGGDNNLALKLASYTPSVRCNPSPSSPASSPQWRSCLSLFSSMPADKNRHMFGHISPSPSQTQLPITYKSPDNRCTLTLDIRGAATPLSWYEVWEGAVAVGSVCVRGKGRGGKGSGLGLGRNVFVWLTDGVGVGGDMLTVGLGNGDGNGNGNGSVALVAGE